MSQRGRKIHGGGYMPSPALRRGRVALWGVGKLECYTHGKRMLHLAKVDINTITRRENASSLVRRGVSWRWPLGPLRQLARAAR